MARILVIRFSALGDVAMTAPVLMSAAEKYPMHEFVVLSKKNMAPIFEPFPENVTFKGVDLKDYKGLPGLYRLFRELKKEKFDFVADLHDVLRSKVLKFLFRMSGVRVASIFKDRSARKALTRQDKKQTSPIKSSSERYADVFASLDLPVELQSCSIYGQEQPELAEDVKQVVGEKEGKSWIGVAPFAAHKGKIYPLEKMEQVLQLLNAQPNVEIFLFGFGEEEKTWCKKCEQEMEHVTSLVSMFGLKKELVLMSHLDVMLSMDSGNMHLASIVQTPVVSVWGATHPNAGFCGLQKKGSQKVQLDLACRPCSIYGNKPCYKGTYECLNQIEPQMVANAVMQVCKERRSGDE